MSEVGQRVVLSALVNAPAVVALYVIAWCFRRVAGRNQWPGRSGPALYWVVAGSAALQIAGFAAIGTDWESVSRVVTIYPSSALFLLLPDSCADRLPDAAFPFLSATSAIMLTAAVAVTVGAMIVVSKEWAVQQRQELTNLANARLPPP